MSITKLTLLIPQIFVSSYKDFSGETRILGERKKERRKTPEYLVKVCDVW
jgi:hypothetical protein